jgi:hypothetical protein
MKSISAVTTFFISISVQAQFGLYWAQDEFNKLIIQETKDATTKQSWTHQVQIDEQTGYIKYFRTESVKGKTKQMEVISIPMCGVAGITEDWDKQEMTIHGMNGSRTVIPMKLGTVRNLGGRMLLLFRAYGATNMEACTENRVMLTDAKSLLSMAVFQHFIRLNVSQSDAEKLLSDPYNFLFVGKCKICDGTRAGISTYLRFYETTAGQSYENDKLIKWGTKEEALAELETLVSEAVDKYLSLHGYTEEELTTLREMLKRERQRSMDMTNAKACASCDGACKLPGTD